MPNSINLFKLTAVVTDWFTFAHQNTVLYDEIFLLAADFLFPGK